MPRGVYHPNAYLSRVRNVKRGLRARAGILVTLERRSADAKTVAVEVGMNYGAVTHHLKLLEVEEIIQRSGSKPHVWSLTGLGQKRLVGTS